MHLAVSCHHKTKAFNAIHKTFQNYQQPPQRSQYIPIIIFCKKLRLANQLLVLLRGNQKDLNFQLHHRFSKFEVPVDVNLKHIFELFGLYTTCFMIQKLLELIRSASDGQFWRKSQNKKGGKFELRSQLLQLYLLPTCLLGPHL